MYWNVTEVEIKKDLTLWVRFADNTSGYVIFSLQFFTGVFAPLKDPQFFKKVFILDGVITWPGEVDLAPDAMYHEIREKGEWRLES